MSQDTPAKPGRPIDPRRIEVIDDISAAIMRRMTGAERLEMMDRMIRDALHVIEHQIRLNHPDWGQEQVQREVARRVSSEAA